jgi:putative ABC transport system permease protein
MQVRHFCESSAFYKDLCGACVTWEHFRRHIVCKKRCAELNSLRSPHRGGFVDTLWHDIRYGLRTLGRSPGFLAVAVLTLALGIGANTAIFSVVDAVLLRPLPFRAPDQLVQLWETESAPGNYPFAGADYLDWRSQNQTFEDMTTYTFQENFNASGAGEPERAVVVEAQSNFFSMLGMEPMIGRAFLNGEDQAGRDHVAVLSYGFWQRHFGGDKTALGKAVLLNGEHYEVVGVMPAWYSIPASADMWTPIDASPKGLGPRGEHHLRAMGRIKAGISVEQARADLKTVAARLEKQYPADNSKVSAIVVPLKEQFVGGTGSQLWVIFGAVTLVLLIACVNVANLLLARSSGRQREIAVRTALGADRQRVIRQLLTESVLLSACGAVPGIGLAYMCVAWLRTAKGLPVNQANPISVEPMVLLFTLAVTVVIGILFGLMPALQSSRVNLNEVLNSGGRMAVTATTRGRLVRDSLVTLEIALSLVLLAGAGLLIRTFSNMRQVDIGVHADKVLTATALLPRGPYKSLQAQTAFFRRLIEQLNAAPGVHGVAVAAELPLNGGNNGYITIKGQSEESTKNQLVEWNSITPDYFRVMGIPVISGRTLTDADVQNSVELEAKLQEIPQGSPELQAAIKRTVIPTVINQTMARRFWPNESAIGKMFNGGGIGNLVIGIVGDTKTFGLGQKPIAQAYFPLAGTQGDRPAPVSIVVQGSGEPTALVGTLRATVSSLDNSLAIFNVQTVPDLIATSMIGTTFQTFLLGVFAGLALLLASVGIYGVLSYVVTQRTNEIGIRMALGAGRGKVLWMILRQGLVLTVIGIGVGVAGTYALTGLLGSLLFGVKATDPLTFIGVSVLMTVVAVSACMVPAWRATRVDPMVALRYE